MYNCFVDSAKDIRLPINSTAAVVKTMRYHTNDRINGVVFPILLESKMTIKNENAVYFDFIAWRTKITMDEYQKHIWNPWQELLAIGFSTITSNILSKKYRQMREQRN